MHRSGPVSGGDGKYLYKRKRAGQFYPVAEYHRRKRGGHLDPHQPSQSPTTANVGRRNGRGSGAAMIEEPEPFMVDVNSDRPGISTGFLPIGLAASGHRKWPCGPE